MKKIVSTLPFFIFSLLMAGCSYTPKVSYEPELINPKPVPFRAASAPKDKTPAGKSQKQTWSVITDSVVLDKPAEDEADDLDIELAEIYMRQAIDNEMTLQTPPDNTHYEYKDPGLTDYYYDSYYPVSYTTYWYYPRQSTVSWYYTDWRNNQFPYGAYSNSYYGGYYGPWYSPYGRSMLVYDDYPYSSVFYSGYYPASYSSPLNYYNPYWAYSAFDYGYGPYASPYISRYGYSPYYSYYDPYYDRNYWRHRWMYNYPKDKEENPQDKTERESRPLTPERKKQIRLTSQKGTVYSPENGGYVSSFIKSARSDTTSSTQKSRPEKTTRSPRNEVSRQQQTTASGWSLPPYRIPASVNNSNPYYKRDEKSGKTIQTSRKPGNTGNNTLAPSTTRETPRTNTFNRWSSNSPASRVSIWERSRTLSPSASSANRRNPVVVSPSSRLSGNQIRVYPPQNRSSSPSYGNSSNSRSFVQPVPRQQETRSVSSPGISPQRENRTESPSTPRFTLPSRSENNTTLRTSSPGRTVTIPGRQSSPGTSSPRYQVPSSPNRTPTRNSGYTPSSSLSSPRSSVSVPRSSAISSPRSTVPRSSAISSPRSSVSVPRSSAISRPRSSVSVPRSSAISSPQTSSSLRRSSPAPSQSSSPSRSSARSSRSASNPR